MLNEGKKDRIRTTPNLILWLSSSSFVIFHLPFSEFRIRRENALHLKLSMVTYSLAANTSRRILDHQIRKPSESPISDKSPRFKADYHPLQSAEKCRRSSIKVDKFDDHPRVQIAQSLLGICLRSDQISRCLPVCDMPKCKTLHFTRTTKLNPFHSDVITS